MGNVLLLSAAQTAAYTGFISLIPTNVVVQLINTLILFLILKKFLFERVRAMIAARENEVEKIYTDAADAKAEAERLQAEYAASIAGAKAEAERIVKDAHKTAQQRSDELLAEARDEAGAMLAKAETDIAREKKKAVNEIKDEISDLALQIAEKVVDREINAADHARMIADFIDGVGESHE